MTCYRYQILFGHCLHVLLIKNFQDATEQPTEAVIEGKKPLKCHSCDTQFTNEEDLNDHTQSEQEEEKPFSLSFSGQVVMVLQYWVNSG